MERRGRTPAFPRPRAEGILQPHDVAAADGGKGGGRNARILLDLSRAGAVVSIRQTRLPHWIYRWTSTVVREQRCVARRERHIPEQQPVEAPEDVRPVHIQRPPRDHALEPRQMIDPVAERVGVQGWGRQRIGCRQRIRHSAVQQTQHMVAQTEAGVIVQDIHHVAQHAPPLEQGARGVEADQRGVEVIRVERRHIRHHGQTKCANAQPVGRQRAPVLVEQHPRAVGADQGDGQVGDARITQEQPDIQRRNNAVNVISQVDVGDGVVQDRHRHRVLDADDGPDGVQGQAEFGAQVDRDARAAQVAGADLITGAGLQRRQISLVNGHRAAQGVGDEDALTGSPVSLAYLQGNLDGRSGGNHA